jgi:hypothetical protein
VVGIRNYKMSESAVSLVVSVVVSVVIAIFVFAICYNHVNPFESLMFTIIS